MPQGTTSRFVLVGIRVVCSLIFLAFVFRDFQIHGWRGVFADMGLSVTVIGLNYANRQGSKLAAENMRKAGLNPDRDEAPKNA